MAVRRVLHALGLRYRVHYPIVLPDLRVRPDVVFSRSQVAVFVDGCYWHGCPQHGTQPTTNSDYWRAKIARNQARDARIDTALMANGWTVVRVWEHDAPESVANRVVQAIEASR